MSIIFAYHSISTRNYKHAVRPEQFQAQVNYLKKHFDLCTVSELLELIQSGKGNDNKLAAITFDDGTHDIYEHAYPIVKVSNIPITIFISTAYIDQGTNVLQGAELSFLTWEELNEMFTTGHIEVQSHTHTHPHLTKLSDDQIEREYVTSKTIIEKRFGNTSTVLAYPKGDHDKRVVSITAEYFSYAFGTAGIMTKSNLVNPYTLPRVTITADVPLWKFKAMTHTNYWVLRELRNKIFCQ